MHRQRLIEYGQSEQQAATSVGRVRLDFIWPFDLEIDGPDRTSFSNAT